MGTYGPSRGPDGPPRHARTVPWNPSEVCQVTCPLRVAQEAPSRATLPPPGPAGSRCFRTARGRPGDGTPLFQI